MNSEERSKQKAVARKSNVGPVVAIHEAGHAVGRYLTAGLMGIPVHESIAEIVVRIPESMPEDVSSDGRYVLRAQATTYGRTYSDEIEAALSRIADARSVPVMGLINSHNTLELRRELMSEVAAQGCDLRQWVWSRTIIAVAGPVAEAAYRRVQITEILYGYEGEDDLRSCIRDALSAGLSTDEANDLVNEAIQWFIRQPKVFEAVSALAAEIPRPGRLSGEAAARIIDHAIAK